MYDAACIGKILQFAAPQAIANILGSEKYDRIRGIISFYDIGNAILVTSSLTGLPYRNGYCRYPVLGLHIHEGTSCSGDREDPFADALGHFNPENCQHPMHAGDLPPVFVNDGIAWSAVITTRFTIRDILGRAVIVHAMPDDFHTQPSGNSGEKIACGIIHKNTAFYDRKTTG